MPIYLLITLSFFLLALGLTLILTDQHTMFMLLGIELVSHGAHLHILLLGSLSIVPIQGSILLLFSMVIMTCKTVIILAIILQKYRFHYQQNNLVATTKHT